MVLAHFQTVKVQMVVKKGRKQHSLTDIMGLLLAVKAQEANNQDSIAGESVLGKLQWCL